uniref:Uncharacterized protein n=1 Tax=Bionectria ochroleuca TaxID=29856 RepID=A0A8H7K774_BIOOC
MAPYDLNLPIQAAVAMKKATSQPPIGVIGRRECLSSESRNRRLLHAPSTRLTGIDRNGVSRTAAGKSASRRVTWSLANEGQSLTRGWKLLPALGSDPLVRIRLWAGVGSRAHGLNTPLPSFGLLVPFSRGRL